MIIYLGFFKKVKSHSQIKLTSCSGMKIKSHHTIGGGNSFLYIFYFINEQLLSALPPKMQVPKIIWLPTPLI